MAEFLGVIGVSTVQLVSPFFMCHDVVYLMLYNTANQQTLTLYTSLLDRTNQLEYSNLLFEYLCHIRVFYPITSHTTVFQKMSTLSTEYIYQQQTVLWRIIPASLRKMRHSHRLPLLSITTV